MVQVTQSEEDIKIVIELNRLITRKPDIVLLPFYLKFNNPPIFFERHLSQEIDEMSSFCRIFKNEARIVLFKKQKGIWPEIFQKLSKEETFKKRLEVADLIVQRNVERDKQSVIRYEQKRRCEIEKEVKRETAMRERVKQFEEEACREALMVGVRKETHAKQKFETPSNPSGRDARLGTPAPAATRSVAALRNSGKINVCFSNYSLYTPKRESQAGVKLPFTVEDRTVPAESANTSLDTLNE